MKWANLASIVALIVLSIGFSAAGRTSPVQAGGGGQIQHHAGIQTQLNSPDQWAIAYGQVVVEMPGYNSNRNMLLAVRGWKSEDCPGALCQGYPRNVDIVVVDGIVDGPLSTQDAISRFCSIRGQYNPGVTVGILPDVCEPKFTWQVNWGEAISPTQYQVRSMEKMAPSGNMGIFPYFANLHTSGGGQYFIDEVWTQQMWSAEPNFWYYTGMIQIGRPDRDRTFVRSWGDSNVCLPGLQFLFEQQGGRTTAMVTNTTQISLTLGYGGLQQEFLPGQNWSSQTFDKNGQVDVVTSTGEGCGGISWQDDNPAMVTSYKVYLPLVNQ